jgi:hypothetical protein
MVDSVDRSRPAAARGRIGRAVVAAVVIAVVVGVILTRPLGPARAAQTEHVPGSTFLPPLVDPGDAAEQPFVGRAAGLTAVEIRFGTFKTRECTIAIEVDTADGGPLAQDQLHCADITDGASTRVAQFPPQANSTGRDYVLRVTLLDRKDGGITLFAGPPPPDMQQASIGGHPAHLTAVLQTYYGEDRRVVDELGTLLGRLDQYGPPWQGGTAIVVLALIGAGVLVALAAGSWGFPVDVALLIALALVRGLLWAALIPPLQAPDEPAHFAYAQFMSVEHAIPKRGHDRDGLPGYSPELVAGIDVTNQNAAAPNDRPDFGPDSTAVDDRRLSQPLSEEAGGDASAAGYSPAYYAVPAAIEAIAPGTIDDRVQAMRLWSIALGVVAAVAGFLLGRRLFPALPSAALALGVGVAMQPMLSQQTSTLNNDALVIAAGTACLVVAVELLRPDRGRWAPLLAGLFAGAAALAKPFGLAMVPVLLAAWLIGRARGARAARWFVEAGWAALGLLATYGLWWCFSVAFGYPAVGIGQEPVSDHRSFADFAHVLTEDWFHLVRKHWIDQFWGNFGAVNTPFPSWAHVLIGAAVALGIVLLGAWAVRALAAWRRGEADAGDLQALVLLAAIVVTIAGLYVTLWSYFSRVGSTDLLQGRYGLMLVPAVLALPALCVPRVFPCVAPAHLLSAAAVAMVGLNVLGLCLVTGHYYL